MLSPTPIPETNPTLPLENQPAVPAPASTQAPTPEPVTLETAPPSSSPKKPLLIIAGLVTLFLAIFGWFSYYQTQPAVTIEEPLTVVSTATPVPTAIPMATTDPAMEEPAPTATESTSPTTIPSETSGVPDGWKQHRFPTQPLTLYTPTQWKSDLQEFPSVPSTLIRLWEGQTADTATMQLNIKQDWNNIGVGPNYTLFTVAGSIEAKRVDPPKMDEQKLDRYQTNFYFESNGKVHVFDCVHNWIQVNIDTCEQLLQTMRFE